MVQRYNHGNRCFDEYCCEAVEADDGEFVLYEDYEKLEREVERLRAMLPDAGPRAEWLWARFGDSDDYGRHDDLMSVADTLRALIDLNNEEYLLVWRNDATGFHIGPFQGNNYVSLFWGDESGALIRGVSKRGRDEFATMLFSNP